MKIRFFAAAAAATGAEEQQVDLSAGAVTLADLSALLVDSYPASASSHTPPLSELLTRCSFLVNEVSTRDLTVVLQAGDVVDVLPPFAGG
ncbi:molybdenum cofactor biosynthesis protein MoaD [Arthrobacter alpinus]|uniref:Molybdenum cofactor biosynthesis protein MoaD n=1 Tax=Arthrobacter alpinus TaxID=656366 RepID=A0A0M5LX26_9MICC|nr:MULTISPECIES: MoaD/ThiS family protein [Arthrobacter]ALE91674.1 molybdenum cofactor biosynthesis protein MoaD [Arthrobacter alpinus]